MNRLAACALWAALALYGGLALGAVDDVQFKENSVDNANTGSVATGSFDSTLTVGNYLVCGIWITEVGAGGTPLGLTMSGAGSPSWQSETTVSTTTEFLYTRWAKITSATTTGVTATFSENTGYPAIACGEFSGIAADSPRLAFAGQNQNTPTTSANALTSGLLGTLSGAPAIIIGFTVDETSTGTPAAGSGFTNVGTGCTYGGTVTASCRMEFRRVTSTDSVAATFTAAANVVHKTFGLALLEAEGEGGGGDGTVVNPITGRGGAAAQPVTVH